MINAATPQPTHPSAPQPIPDDKPRIGIYTMPMRSAAHMKGKHIYKKVPDRLHHLITGTVQLYREQPGDTSESPARISIGICGPGMYFGEGAVLENGEREWAFALDRGVETESWHPADVRRAMLILPEARSQFQNIVAARLTDYAARLVEFYSKTPARVALTLLRLDRHVGRDAIGLDEGDRLLPALTHQVISEEVGTSREIVTFQLNRLRRMGAIQFSRKSIRIVRRDILKAEAAHV